MPLITARWDAAGTPEDQQKAEEYFNAVAVLDPEVQLGLTGRDDLKPLAADVKGRLVRALDAVKTTLSRTPVVGTPLYTALHGLKRGIKVFLQPQVLFEDLGMKYLGPVDGHDTAAMEAALRRAKAFGGPVIVHAVTVKGSLSMKMALVVKALKERYGASPTAQPKRLDNASPQQLVQAPDGGRVGAGLPARPAR